MRENYCEPLYDLKRAQQLKRERAHTYVVIRTKMSAMAHRNTDSAPICYESITSDNMSTTRRARSGFLALTTPTALAAMHLLRHIMINQTLNDYLKQICGQRGGETRPSQTYSD